MEATLGKGGGVPSRGDPSVSVSLLFVVGPGLSRGDGIKGKAADSTVLTPSTGEEWGEEPLDMGGVMDESLESSLDP